MIEADLQRASELVEQSQFGPATQILAQCLDSEPESVRGISLMADAQAGLHGPEAALKFLAGKMGERPHEPEFMARVALFEAGSGQLSKAVQSYQQYLEGMPEDAVRWLELSQVFKNLRRYQEAAQACAKAIEHAPQDPEGYLKLGELLQQFGSFPQAINVYQQGLLQIPGNPRLQGDLAAAYKDGGQTDHAQQAFDQALALDPNNALTYYNLATLKLETGDLAGAQQHLRSAVRLEPRFAQAYQQLAQLDEGSGPESDDTLARMESLAQDANMPSDGQARILFGLARLYDLRGNYRKAMRACSKANALRSDQRPFDAAQFEQAINRHRRVFSSALQRRFPAMTAEAPRVVVIAGMPRSGTTLIDQMLCGHPEMVSLGENDFMTKVKGQSVRRFQNRFGYPDSIQNCSPIDLMALRDTWYSQARAAAPGARIVVDKTLTNYLNIGLFKLLFPDCVVVESVRQWKDVALSMFFADFAHGHEYAFTRAGLRRFQESHASLMDHWRKLAADAWVPVEYEQLVKSPGDVLAPIFSELGLAPHTNLESFYQRDNQVRTLSQTQIRKPLNSGSVDRYKHYEAHWP